LSFNVHLFTAASDPSEALLTGLGTVACPNCGGDVTPSETLSGWRECPYCEKRLQIGAWPVTRTNTNAAVATPEQATCFFHPDRAFQSCCQRCGRFVCALCDLQLGTLHVCPTCFERGMADSGQSNSKAEWRHRDVLYDSIAAALGWGWILVWPVIVVAVPTAVYLHVRFRKAPSSYLIPRSAWRFWAAYGGFLWLPLLVGGGLLIGKFARGR
jgi:hypothetical protein